MMAGADLDRQNKFGVTPRSWLERSPEDVIPHMKNQAILC